MSNGGTTGHSATGARQNGKFDLKTLLLFKKRSTKRSDIIDDQHFNGSNSDSSIACCLLKTSDTELDQLISGDENFDIDDVEMFVGDRIALEKFGQGIDSSNIIIDPSSTSSMSSSARRNQRNSFVINP